jgi:hypothetical protein
MPQLANLVLTDRTTPTPVNHTFTPREISDGTGYVVESTGVPIGDNRFAVSLKQTPNGSYKATARLTLPITQTQTINGVSSPVVVRTAYANVEFTFAASSTEDERKNAVGMLVSSLDAAKWVNDLVVKLQGVY